MGQRNRGIALSEDGIKVARAALCGKGWTLEYWSLEAYLSLSTIKRLLNGERVEESSLRSALKAFSVEFQDNYIIPKQSKKLPVISLPYIPVQAENTKLLQQSLADSSSQYEFGVFMTATFIQDKRLQVEKGIQHLEKFLVNTQVTFLEDKETGTVAVSGDFCEKNRKHIEVAIAHLEKLFTTWEVTW